MGYERVCWLDADMVVVRNMDEVFEVGGLDGEGRVFAATHACVCNPKGFGHYPRDWRPGECAFNNRGLMEGLGVPVTGEGGGGDAGGTKLADGGSNGHTSAICHGASLGQLNAGLILLRPSLSLLHSITTFLTQPSLSPTTLPFADQSLLSTLFHNRWTPLPYVYNALKPMREAGVHGGERVGGIWRDGEVKCVHYILTPKPWEMKEGAEMGVTEKWWWRVEGERKRWEEEMGLDEEGGKGASCGMQIGGVVGEGRWFVVG